MSFKTELYRKFVHTLSSIIPLFYLFSTKDLTLKILIPLTITLMLLDISRFNIAFINKIYMTALKDVMRVHEKKRFAGCTYLAISSILVIILYDKGIAVACLLFLTVSDSAAALFGKSFGKINIYNKTLEGSLAFLFSSLIIVYFIKSLDLLTGLCGAVIATYVELVFTRIDDNFSIPIISGMIMQLISTFLL